LYNDDEMMSPCLFVSSTYLMQWREIQAYYSCL
jgi:hypothetical protein